MAAVRQRSRRRAIESSDEQAWKLARRDDNASTHRKKNLMIQAMVECKCNITAACREVGISRQTHHNWLASDPDYEKAIQWADDEIVHNMESLFLKWSIEKKDLRSARWFLERRDRQKYGKTERVEHTGADGGPIESSSNISIDSLREEIPDDAVMAALEDVLEQNPQLLKRKKKAKK